MVKTRRKHKSPEDSVTWPTSHFVDLHLSPHFSGASLSGCSLQGRKLQRKRLPAHRDPQQLRFYQAQGYNMHERRLYRQITPRRQASLPAVDERHARGDFRSSTSRQYKYR